MGNTCSNGEEPPPIPPKPHLYQNANPPPSSHHHDVPCKPPEQEYVVVQYDKKLLGEPMTIGELVEENKTQLPLCLSVSDSLYGICGENSLMEDQLLHVHFLKEMKVLLVKAKSSNKEYNLPICSILEVSVLYDPNKRSLEAKKGLTFSRTEDLINAVPLPKIVCALVAFKDLNDKEIEAAAVLYIEELCNEEDKEEKYITCVNFSNGESYKIDKTCESKFTTAPEKIRMPVDKMLERVSLPVDVTVSSPADSSIVLPGSALNAVYTIVEVKTEESVIASTKYTSEDGSATSTQTIEIFLSVPIEVQLVDLRSKDSEALKREAKAVYSNFHAVKVSTVICDLDSSTNIMQTELYKAIRRDSLNTDSDLITIHTPSGILSQEYDENIYDTGYTNEPEDPEEDYIDMDVVKKERANTAPLPRKQSPPMAAGNKTSTYTPADISTRRQLPPTMRQAVRPPQAEYNTLASFQQQQQHSVNITGTYSPGNASTQRQLPPTSRQAVRPPQAEYNSLPPIQQHLQQQQHQQQNSVLLPKQFQKRPPMRPAVDDDIKIAPYLVARRNQEKNEDDEDSMTHERPYDYVKFSKDRDLEILSLRKQLEQLQAAEKQNTYGPRQDIALFQVVVGGDATDVERMRQAEENKMKLSKYTCEEIIEILITLGLKQYSEVFMKEAIDGTIFIEFDEQILEEELGMTSKLHRIKILRLLDGRQALESLDYN